MPILTRWPYLWIVTVSGDLQADAENFLTANGKPKTAAHCLSVADTCKTIAARFGLDQPTAFRSGLLHDIAAVVRPPDMLAYAAEHSWELDQSEREHPFLLHQRLSAVIAKEMFSVNDAAVLSAIACHSTLKADPSAYDMALFLADKLAWDQEGTPPFYDAVASALHKSLGCASLVYIRFALEHGMILSPHPWLLDAKNWLESRG